VLVIDAYYAREVDAGAAAGKGREAAALGAAFGVPDRPRGGGHDHDGARAWEQQLSFRLRGGLFEPAIQRTSGPAPCSTP
jgi:hypothetical protein